MWHWFTYSSYDEETKTAEEDSNESSSDVSPTFDALDPRVCAATLAQAAFRGYRLRERLRRLPAREAERQIKALHNNARGFRRVALFLVFAGLFFSIVFHGVDVGFQREVQQALTDHLSQVHYGPNSDKNHHDVSSLADLHQWMQALYRRTYDGTQLEHPCMACAIKPPDDACEPCDADFYQEVIGDDDDRASSGGDGSSDSSSSSSSGGSHSSNALTELCTACWIGTSCNLDDCEAALGVNSSAPSSPSSSSSAAASNTSPEQPSSSFSSSFSSAANNGNISALLDALDFEPKGGVSASAGHLTVQNASQCYNFFADVGRTESLGRFREDLGVTYTGNGYVGDRNRIIGGMLVTFTRRTRLSGEQCGSSLDYYDVCLSSDDTNKTSIVPPEIWFVFRPTPEVIYSEEAEGYPVLVDTGGFNIGLNFGYCTLLLMESLDVIPTDEVRSVAVQLVTYNGNEKSAYGSINIHFGFDHGGKVVTKEVVTAYILDGSIDNGFDGKRSFLIVVFTVITLGMIRHDIRKWCRARRSKTKSNAWHCCCGFTFFFFVLLDIFLWLAWAGFGTTLTHEEGLQSNPFNGDTILDSVTGQVIQLQEAALFSSAIHMLFLITTMLGLYRWIFQMLTFHKRMSIVTDTLSHASTDLYHFLLVFFLVNLVFAPLTWLLVGSSTLEFSTLEKAWQSVTRISLGESENFYPQILEAQPTVGPVVVVLYQVLGVVLLLNVVIAVLLQAYRGVVGSMRGEDTIFQSFVAFVGMSLDDGDRPSLKVFLQGSTGVYGVDGQPVVMIRRPPGGSSTNTDRQLSFNCPRYITVTEMQALIEATPVPAGVADRLVRKIVHDWVFHSNEKVPGDFSRSFVVSGGSSNNGNNTGSPSRRNSGSTTDSSRPMLRLQASSASR